MSTYFGYFFSGPDQFIGLGAVLILWGLLTVLGRTAALSGNMPEVNAVLGWALVSTVMTMTGVFSFIPFTLVAGTMGVTALGAAGWAWRSGHAAFPGGAWKMLALSLPLLLIASAMEPSQWDEFSHWLPAPRFLLLTDAFPSATNPITGTQMLPAYPYAWVFLSYLTGRIAGFMVDNAGSLLNLLLLFSFGFTALRLALQATGRDMPAHLSWPLAALALMGGVAFNPSFVEKVALTAYADTSTSVCVGFAAVLAWRLLCALAEGKIEDAKRDAWRFGLVAAVLINIKQTNLVPYVLILATTGLVALRDPAIRLIQLAKIVPWMIGPSLMIYLVWRYHVATAMDGFPITEAVFLQFADWNVEAIPQILASMLKVATSKGAYFGVMAVAVMFAARGLIRFDGPFARLSILCGGVFLGYESFMLFIYVASFGEGSAKSAVSFWRYNMHIGLLSVIFGAYGVGLLWKRYVDERHPIPTWIKAAPVLLVGVVAVLATHRYLGREWPMKAVNAVLAMTAAFGLAWVVRGRIPPQIGRLIITALPVTLTVAVPLLLAPMIRFDHEAPKPHATRVVKELVPTYPAGRKMIILDPTGTGEVAVIARYYLNRFSIPYISAFQNPTTESVAAFLVAEAPDDVLVFSVTPAVTEALGLSLESGVTTQITRRDGAWVVEKSWPQPSADQPFF
ncbi:MAG: hypothetical protein A2516_10230 [Alphaproteobacteria bacterium RIFOXYD12_FULL_60_8]|nr:MAG: hypothetical protein A2516_10230 [Alphaproteobacteria bacterium RIFOXYD12_FULL_60_8]